MILTNSEDALSEEQFSALEKLHRSEGSAWLGRDLRRAGTRARLKSNLFCNESRSRVDQFIHDCRTYSTRSDSQRKTVVQRRAFPSAENCDTRRSPQPRHAERTVIQGEALSHAMQFAQRLRDTADEELVTPLENFVATAYCEPDLAEELDRADEAVEAEADEEIPSPSQQRQLLRAHVNLGPSYWRILSCLAKWPLPTGCCQMGETLFQMPGMRSTTDAENSAGSSFAEMLPFSIKFVASTQWKFGIRWIEKTQFEYRTSSVMGHVTTREHAGRT